MHKVTLYGGTVVRVRPVPPHVWRKHQAITKAAMPPAPPPPERKVRGAAGNVETIPAEEGTPEYDEWLIKWDAWAAETAQQQADFEDDWRSLSLDYAVIDWRFPGQERTSTPPEDWVYPDALIRHGINPGEVGRRMEYIYLEVMATPTGEELITAAAFIPDLTEPEVEAQLAGFLPTVGRKGASSGNAPGVGDLGESVSGGDAGSENKGKNGGRVVRAIARIAGRRRRKR